MYNNKINDSSYVTQKEFVECINAAEKAYLYGQQRKAETLYLKSFELSINLLNTKNLSTQSIQRVVDSCFYCFDFCPLLEDSDEFYFLETASDSFIHIIQSNINDAIKCYTLGAFSEIAGLAEELVLFSKSMRSEIILQKYRKIKKVIQKLKHV